MPRNESKSESVSRSSLFGSPLESEDHSLASRASRRRGRPDFSVAEVMGDEMLAGSFPNAFQSIYNADSTRDVPSSHQCHQLTYEVLNRHFLSSFGTIAKEIQEQTENGLPTTKFISIPFSFSHFTANLPIDPLPTVILPTEILPLFSREFKTWVQWLVHTNGEKEGLGGEDIG